MEQEIGDTLGSRYYSTERNAENKQNFGGYVVFRIGMS